MPGRQDGNDRAAADHGVPGRALTGRAGSESAGTARRQTGAAAGSDAADAVARTFRAEFGRAVAILARGFGGDVDRAEEAVQDAYAVALDRWPRDGIPSAPAAWILTTAKRRALDRLRREAALRDKQALLARQLEHSVRDLPTEDPEMIPDERLGLVFACCHPALAVEAQVPLTLRLVGGLTVPEIARALLLPEATVAQRLVRAKRNVRLSGIPLAEPAPEALPARLTAVLAVLYLVFNEGYAATTGELVRDDLATEAIRLARIVHELLPAEPEPAGLLALMLLHQARRPARVSATGELVLLSEQDRGRWDGAAIAAALPLVDAALTLRRPPGPYALQAAIAAVHARAANADETDWREIALLYGELVRVLPSPVIALNKAVAVAMAWGPAAGLALVDELVEGGELDDYHLLHATRADLLRRQGETGAAAAAYERALQLATNEAERRFLAARLAECRS